MLEYIKGVAYSVLSSIPHIVPNFIHKLCLDTLRSFSVDKIAIPGTCPESVDCMEHACFSLQHSQDFGPINTDMANKPLVLFIGGAFDGTLSKTVLYSTMINGLFPKYYSEHHLEHDVAFATWNCGILENVVKNWWSAGQDIYIIGHSWGGDTAINLARELDKSGVTIKGLCTIDPVSFDGVNSKVEKPANVDVWVNCFVDQLNLSSLADFPAIVGGHWGECPEADSNLSFDKLEIDNNSVVVNHAMVENMFYNCFNNLGVVDYFSSQSV